ncbi:MULTISPECIES: hypothetical protein [unclassified Streptomyces]|uniref:hypothetical protein n=1 Tax=unclassified Streptomyces TaxID=2593676 RepID=UPI000A3EBA9A|nr:MULTISPECIES: hypothetical protein [unclassified Streptomyces]
MPRVRATRRPELPMRSHRERAAVACTGFRATPPIAGTAVSFVVAYTSIAWR